MPYSVMTEQQRLHSLKTVGGTVITIGDEVIHEGADENETAIVTGFYWHEELGEYRAETTRGHAGLDYLGKV